MGKSNKKLTKAAVNLRIGAQGVVLLDDYKNARTKHRFRCTAEGHIWITSPQVPLRGGSCPICRGRYKQELLPRNASIETRFWSYVNKNGPKQANQKTRCWVWTGGTDPSGYGVFWYEGSKVGAHRVSLKLKTGSFPKHWALHKCDHKPCVRPTHLYDGVGVDNTRDAISSGNFGKQVLTRKDVEQIHEDIKMGKPIKEIAKDYNVTRGHISNIKNGHTWKESEA